MQSAVCRSIRMFDLLLANRNRPPVHSSSSDQEAGLLKIRVRERANGNGNQIRAPFGLPAKMPGPSM